MTRSAKLPARTYIEARVVLNKIADLVIIIRKCIGKKG
jgi:hypothetical protein